MNNGMHTSKRVLLGTLVAMQLLNSTYAAEPVVNLTRPTNGAVLITGTPIFLTASATDADGTVSFVDFFADSLNLGRASGPSTNGFYNLVWSNAPAGMFQLRAEAVDNAGDRGISASVQVAVSGVTNVPPTLSPLLNLSISEDTGNQTVALSGIGPGAASESQTLTITALSSDPSLIPNPAINYTSPNANGSLTFAPVANSFGVAIITVLVDDGQTSQNIVARSFSVTVLPVNDLPVISAITDRTINENTAAAVVFTVQDVETPASSLIVSGNSDNPALVPSANLAFGGSGTNRILTVIPALNRFGTATITVMARDTAGGTTSREFSVTVVDTNNVLPIVNLALPTNGAAFAPGAPIFLTASATDVDGTVSFVDFFAGSLELGRANGASTNGLYSLVWSNAPAGMFQLRAEAVDNVGGRGISAPVQIVVGAGTGAVVDLGRVETSTIGHALFNPNIPRIPPILPNAVTDFLVDQNQSSGGGGVLRAISVNWDTNVQFKLTVSAPQGMKFEVAVPAGREVKFGGFLWWESTRGGFSAPGQVMANFTDLEGTAPEFTQSDSVLSDSHGFFGFVDLEGTGVTNSFAFTSITLTGTVAPQYTGNGTENYLPHLESSMQLYYSTTETNDPGSFVSIVPAGALPMIQMIGTSPETGVDLMIYGRAGLTHIVECSPDTVTWTAIASAVMPAAASMPIRDASATTVGSRFYRVVEIP